MVDQTVAIPAPDEQDEAAPAVSPLRRLARRPELTQLALTFVFGVVGIALIWFTSSVVHVHGDALFVAELFFVLLVYLVLSGRVSELSAGGVSAKFRAVARDRVDVDERIDLSPISPQQLVAKGPVGELERRASAVAYGSPSSLVLTVVPRTGRTKYQAGPLQMYIDRLATYPRFYFVILVHADLRLIGFVPAAALAAWMRADSPRTQKLVDDLNGANAEPFRAVPGFTAAALTPESTNAQALDRMAQLKLPALVAVTDDGRVLGIVERERLVEKLVLALARTS